MIPDRIDKLKKEKENKKQELNPKTSPPLKYEMARANAHRGLERSEGQQSKKFLELQSLSISVCVCNTPCVYVSKTQCLHLFVLTNIPSPVR